MHNQVIGAVIAESDQIVIVVGNHESPPDYTNTICPWKGFAN
jgi:uncharacterized protein (DUF427 family)